MDKDLIFLIVAIVLFVVTGLIGFLFTKAYRDSDLTLWDKNKAALMVLYAVTFVFLLFVAVDDVYKKISNIQNEYNDVKTDSIIKELEMRYEELEQQLKEMEAEKTKGKSITLNIKQRGSIRSGISEIVP